jgi:hypothetical protein
VLAGRLVDNFDSYAFNFTRDKEEFLRIPGTQYLEFRGHNT